VRRIVLIAISAIMALVVAVPIASGQTTPTATDTQTLGELGAEWWTWALEEPVPTNPLQDKHKASQCQGTTSFEGGEVLFLAGTTSGNEVTRKCTVTSDTWLFFPVVNTVELEPTGTKTEEALRRIVNDRLDLSLNGSTMFATVDGEPIAISEVENRADTPLFTVDLPKNNIFGVKPEPYEAVADGVWVLLPPLSEGTHTITFGGTFRNGAFSQNNTYILKVV
jgi:hypothetical protein